MMEIQFFEQGFKQTIQSLKQPRVVVERVDKNGYVLKIVDGSLGGQNLIFELHKQRGGIRFFKTLDSVISLLDKFEVDTCSIKLKLTIQNLYDDLDSIPF